MKKLFNSTFFISICHPFNSQKRKEIRNEIRENEKKLENRLFLSNAPEALKILSEAISKYTKPIKIWLEFGTLLGYYRESNILQHDTDIDFGIEENNLIEDFIQHLEKSGFKLLRKFVINSNLSYLNNFTAEYTIQYKENVSIDFFIFKNIKNKKICYCFDENNKNSYNVSYIEFDNFELEKTTFLNQEFYRPNNIQKHLTSYYGDDFMIPKSYSYENRPKDREIQLDQNTIGIKVL
ncbi:phosphodiesterase [Aggregatibacter actinomycetemcomitans]|uniref:phosphodiesterase n=1 Tax=Aggregatibacter actinomycetemcomitans TaxID=714 RepID=UPI00197BED77|nr:phosphodiesterase [Aggregatibacter actinomycetemcomitans]MBN6081960.1 phosphodiesterase [Aggregatibacter actinomycetemcomitans]